MMYSVWDHAQRQYDYYRTPETSAATSAPKPAHLRTAALGISPERAAWPLPSNAHPVGHGKYPKGFIAGNSGGASLGFIPDMTLSNVVLLGAVGWMVYTFLWKPSQKGL